MAVTTDRDRAKAIERLESKLSRPQLTKTVAAYLTQQRLTKNLDAIMRTLKAIRAQRGIVEAELTSAFPISQANQRIVKGLLKKHYPNAKEIIITQGIDPSLVGGIRLTTDDLQLDTSITTKLRRLLAS